VNEFGIFDTFSKNRGFHGELWCFSKEQRNRFDHRSRGLLANSRNDLAKSRSKKKLKFSRVFFDETRASLRRARALRAFSALERATIDAPNTTTRRAIEHPRHEAREVIDATSSRGVVARRKQRSNVRRAMPRSAWLTPRRAQ
jgi:hypothetical protein